MKTAYPDIFGALAAPIPADQVKTKPGRGGKPQRFITARTVMNRLDNAVGPENWSTRFFECRGVLFCEIAITLPDGRIVTKTDAGGFTTMMADRGSGEVDEKNTSKTGASDAFKRAAIHWGVGRELYRDGTALDEEEEAEPPPRREPPPPPRRSGPEFPRSWDEALARAVARWFAVEPIPDPSKLKGEQTAREHRVAHHVVSEAIAESRVAEGKVSKPNAKGEMVRDPKEVWGAVKWLWEQDPDWVWRVLVAYIKGKAEEAKAAAEQPTVAEPADGFANWLNRQAAGHKRAAAEILAIAVGWGARQGFFEDPFFLKGDSFELDPAESVRLATIAHSRDPRGLTKEVGSAIRAADRAPESAAAEGGQP